MRDATPAELDDVGALLGDVYGVFRDRLPADAWTSYIGEIVDVGARIEFSELIVADRDGALVGTIALYPDHEIGEMFAGRMLTADISWQAQAYRLDLKEA